MIGNCLKGKPLPIYGDGKQIRDWLYVRDHAIALIEILAKGKIGETYNIGGNNEKRNIDVVVEICSKLDKLVSCKPNGIESFHNLIKYVADRPGHDCRYAIDSSKLQGEVGWSPEETFETGIDKTIRWYLDNQYWVASVSNQFLEVPLEA